MKLPKKLELNISIDLEAITKAVEDSKTLDDNELIFAKLSAFAFERKQVDLFNDTFEDIERMVKQIINDKAKALYGPNWTAIKGTGYKINRSLTGQVYQISEPEKIDESFVKVKVEPNTQTIGDYVKEQSKLPEGIIYNPNRNESIRLTVKPDDNKA